MKRDLNREWKMRSVGCKFTNGKGTVREVVEVLDEGGYARDRKVRWKKVEGRLPDYEGGPE